MSKESEIIDIVDEVFYKDVAGIIKSYLFASCKVCNVRHIEERMIESYDNSFYCFQCVKKPDIRKCSKCSKYYSIENDGILICAICLKVCCVYCSDCFNKNKVNLYTYTDNPHFIYYWLSLDATDTDIDTGDID